jgi:hypothetical protein
LPLGDQRLVVAAASPRGHLRSDVAVGGAVN